jgi:membrane-bound lytic murein transglycosylase B
MRRACFPVVLGLMLLAGAAPARAQDLPPVAPLPPERPPFDVWLAELRAEAGTRGIRPEILDAALTGVEPVEQVLGRDRSQAEFTLDLEAYLKRLTRDTVRTAQRMYTKYRSLLQRVSKRYRVDPRILVSIWGLESNFGRFAGVRPTIPTLATLAYDARRSTMFRAELLNALQILNDGDIDLARLRGSWAGALGQPQFMPSSYLQYAQDFDEDGRRDIWSSLPDVFASIAYYLQQRGWTSGVAWGREVGVAAVARKSALELPRREAGCARRAPDGPPRPLQEWRPLGFRTISGKALPKAGFRFVHRRRQAQFPRMLNYERCSGITAPTATRSASRCSPTVSASKPYDTTEAAFVETRYGADRCCRVRHRCGACGIVGAGPAAHTSGSQAAVD